MYNLAIESVRKYPLPIICGEQLATLEGFGDFFINRVSKIIKKHYTRGRMPTPEEMDEDDREHLEEIRDKTKESRFKMEEFNHDYSETENNDYISEEVGKTEHSLKNPSSSRAGSKR